MKGMRIRYVFGFALVLGVASTASAEIVPAPYQLKLVTSDTAGSHTTTPGGTYGGATGVNVDGVGRLSIRVPNGPGGGDDAFFSCTGSLLLGGQAIITAAHCVTSNVDGSLIADQVTANFHLTSGTVQAVSTNIIVHSGYNGNTTEGNDLALIIFGSPLNAAIPRYDIFRGTSIGQDSIKVGYGRTGIGSSGATVSSTTKRWGLNKYDADGRDVLSAVSGNGTNPYGDTLPATGLTLAYDFDSGSSNNNALGDNWVGFGNDISSGLGYGNDEVNSAPGDSGGPTFIREDGLWKIAGITSYGFGFVGAPDVNSSTDSSWGEVSVDMQALAYLSFIEANAPGFVPEPGSMAVLLTAACGFCLRRRRA